MKRTICVYCSSSGAVDKQYLDLAKKLGEMIGERGFNLIHGGGKVGLMGILSPAVQSKGGKVTGVLPDRLNIEGIASETDDEIIITDDMSDRKSVMRKRSNAFIALPGGFGTLEELLEVITLKQLQYHQKPVVIINVNHFYDPLLAQFDIIFSQSFAKPEFKQLYHVVTEAEDAMNYIQNYKYIPVKDKWYDFLSDKTFYL
jgi:hypothetical protein